MQRSRPQEEGALNQLQTGRLTMRNALIIAVISTASLANSALAKPVVVKPIVDARLRYETVDQAGVAGDADALTVRVRAGATAKASDFTFLWKGKERWPLSRSITVV